MIPTDTGLKWYRFDSFVPRGLPEKRPAQINRTRRDALNPALGQMVQAGTGLVKKAA